MAQPSKDPEVFLTQIDDALDDVSAKIGQYFEAVATSVTSHLDLIGGLTGGLAGYFLGKHLKEQCEDKMKEISELWDKVAGQIRQDVGSMLGDPLKMSGISSAYKDAVTALGEQHGKVEQANAYLADSWSGNAYIAYTNMSTSQLEAIQGMSDMLKDAADLLDDHAVELLSFWNKQLQNVLDLATDVVGLIGELGNVGNWPTAGAGTAIKVIAAAGSSATTILTDTNQYMIDLNVGRAGDWDSLTATFGERGLPGKQWPDYSDLDKGNINGPWKPS
ncbi:hypothetical protein [Nocardioides flavescens]|uniref:Uncharacterized protein n=1 Tax=Nocardioides flavescens TaxID=2691959 RepID=A0A6L7EUG5_9ACTN|nr:hypothetical protein [Nocardioides flavescens]MXG91157.1 hypothetical protein [Nocardioides flavescens]